MQLTENKITSIVYESKSKGEISSRVIVPTSVPADFVRAIDVSDLQPQEREEMAQLYAEYREYREEFMSRLFNFETWVEHTKNKSVTPKWRAFKLDGLK